MLGDGALLVRSVARGGLGIAVLAACLFLSSGRLDWGMAWAYLGVSTLALAASLAILALRDPALLAERSRLQPGTKPWDKVIAPLVALVLPLAILVVAGLDKRFAWSPALPLAPQIAALAVAVLGFALVLWAMLSNTFFSATVRLQRERGHRVVSGGPYRHLRHPGYAGAIVANLALPLALGSLWGLVPAALVAVLLVLRTVLEDRVLGDELEGYRAYAGRVRHRLLPGLW